jgi:hypothetical protein
MSMLPTVMNRSSAIPVKIPITFFWKQIKAIPSFVLNHRKLPPPKTTEKEMIHRIDTIYLHTIHFTEG